MVPPKLTIHRNGKIKGAILNTKETSSHPSIRSEQARSYREMKKSTQAPGSGRKEEISAWIWGMVGEQSSKATP
jgi:hypothetical protein